MKPPILDPLSVGPAHDVANQRTWSGATTSRRPRASATRSTSTLIGPGVTSSWRRTLAIQEKSRRSARPRPRSPRGEFAGGAARCRGHGWAATYAICSETARARQKLDALHALEEEAVRRPGDLRRDPQRAGRNGRGAALVREGLAGPDAEHGLRAHRSAESTSRLAGNARCFSPSSTAWAFRRRPRPRS